MCGIAGMVCWDDTQPDANELQRLLTRLRHRGPDGEGRQLFARAALGHRRLSIIDLAGGQQPLANEDESVWITFNGEIYNYRELRQELEKAGHSFRTHSDTEVIVHAYEQWGDRCVERLRGMFAFAIWEERRQRLFLARDRLGIKPLVYWWHNRRLYFASELQAFEALDDPPLDVDLCALDAYLELLYVPSPLTIYQGVRKLPPGHYLVLEGENAPKVARYWSLPASSGEELGDGEWLQRLEDTLTESVRLHLRADVEIGALLSSGVDSSLIVALACRSYPQRLKTYVVGFDDKAYDEAAGARTVAEMLATDHHETRVQVDANDLLPTLVRHHGEPFADSSALPTYLICERARRDVKVVLSGDGGDEGFAGYPWVHGLARAFEGPDADLVAALRRRARLALGRFGLWPAHTRPSTALRASRSIFSKRFRARLWRPHLRQALRNGAADQPREADSADLCAWASAYDYQGYLPDDVLTKVDVASMAHGLEVRVPLLDHKVVELAVQMPRRLKLSLSTDARQDGCESKVALRTLLKRYLPAEVSRRPKKGFAMPLHRWLEAVDVNWLDQSLFNPSSRLLELFRRPSLESMLRQSGRDHGAQLWSLVILAEWFRQHPRVRLPLGQTSDDLPSLARGLKDRVSQASSAIAP